MTARHWSDGERELWAETQRDAMPDVVELESFTATVKRGRKCTRCGATMPPGTPFHRFVAIVDGTFEVNQVCLASSSDVLGCDHDLRRRGLERCPECKGEGYAPSNNKAYCMPPAICQRCQGKGRRPISGCGT